ncbi:unnamed protein product [Clavelina lepadiformis]|uniref:Nuclear pore complex protein Nup155 n=1 Tax=Clavelina lepadiformis TaxID=159417 RepID=A0ABP0GQ89_CLALP
MAIEMDSSNLSPSSQACSGLQDVVAVINKLLLHDRESIDLSAQLGVTSMYSGVCSGLKSEDYPSSDVIEPPLITDVRRVPLPPELVEQFAHMQCNCIIGVFPEIGRAWLTVDSDIFVWRYADGDDLAYFDGLSETILSVALVQPKQGIFRDHIKYLLVLTTPLDVVILGVSFAGDDVNNEMHLLPDPLFSLSSDGVYLLHTVGTDNGRIFTGGKDGCLYEVTYQASGGWFSRKCNKINHSRSRFSFLLPSVVSVWLNEEDSICQLTVDDTRNILYSRSEKGTITVYDLGSDGQSVGCVAQLRLPSIQRRARDIASGVEPSNFNELVYITPITLRESRYLHLVAVTQSGVRLYFMTCQAATGDVVKLRPTGIHLVHVRLPPGFTGSSIHRPMSVHSAHYNTGTLLLASSSGDDGILWCINRDMYAFDKMLRESQCNFGLDGRAWVIAEVATPFSPLTAAVLPAGSTAGLPPNPPIHVVQHIQRPSEYVIISSQGCHMFNKLRPVDQLRHLLESTSDVESQSVENFFKLYKDGEAGCCCIILAMSAVPTDFHIAERATAAFTHHWGIPQVSLQQGVSLTSPMPLRGMSGLEAMSPISLRNPPQQFNATRTPGGLPVISTPMPGSNPPLLANQSPGTFPSAPPSPDPSSDMYFYTTRQHSVYKMFARIMRPLWDAKLVEDYVVTEGGKQKSFVVNRIDVEVVSLVLNDLIAFKKFFNKHCTSQVQWRESISSDRNVGRNFRRPVEANSVQRDLQKRQLAEVATAELSWMRFLHDLLHKSTEVLGLWRILLHHQLHVLFESLDKVSQTALKSATFEGFILSGQALCSALISALVGKYLDDNSTIDALSSQLREVCPALYSPDDAICSKASELLNAVRSVPVSQRIELLEEAVRLFQQVAHSINLPVVVQQLQAARYYTGVVELCLHAASKRDEEGLALKLYKSSLAANDPGVDPGFRKAYLSRVECYKCVTDMLDELMLAGESHPQTPSVPTKPGPPQPVQSGSSSSSLGALQAEDAQQHADSCMKLALRSNDELFHVTLYEWMLRKRLPAQLLRVTSPFIESFLQRVAESHEENPTSLGAAGSDLLWQYYERNGQHVSAASILGNLAEKPGSDRDLSKRIEYLSRARMNAKSVTSVTADSATGGQLLHELEEKLEVAQIQLETYEQLKELNETDAARTINYSLLDVTQLYREYAEPYQLAEGKLAIVHCAGLHDPSLVESLWQNIVEHELRKRASSDVTMAASLQHKLIQLGKRYLSSQRYFPIEFLAGYFEKMSMSRGWSLNWAFTIFLESGLPLVELLDVYGNVHKQKLPCWSEQDDPFRILFVINEMLKIFLDQPNNLVPSDRQRRNFVDRSLDALSVHLVQLHSVTSPNESVRALMTELRRTQASLQAMQERR